MKTLKKYMNRFCISIILVYSLNIVLNNFNILLPINYFSSIIYTLFGFPGVIIYVMFVIRYR